MFNVNGEIRVVGITVLHGRFRGYRCHVADFISNSAILLTVPTLLPTWGGAQLSAQGAENGRLASELCHTKRSINADELARVM